MLRRFTALLPVLALAAAAACDQGSTGPNAGGNTRFLISQGAAAGPLASLVSLDDQGSTDGHGRSIPLSAIRSIDVRVTGIAALPVGRDSIRDDDWFKLMTAAPVNLNLLALPTKADSGLQVLRGTLPAGTYGHLRILFDMASITFRQTTTVGDGKNERTFKADSTYPLFIGGFGMPDHDEDDQQAEAENHFGIVVPATTFTVPKDSTTTVVIVFDPASTVQRVLLTGKGLRLAPVIRAAKHEEKGDHDKGDGKGNHD